MVQLSEGPVQRGNGKGGPTTPKPVILPEGQASASAAFAKSDGPALLEDYIDPEHEGEDRALLEAYYVACNSEGGTADEITLRGLRAVLARWGQASDGPASVAGEPSDDDLALIYHDCCNGCELMDQVGFEDAARAVLARWGRPAPAPAGEGLKPVAVSELPGAKDCDAQGRCWLFGKAEGDWRLLDPRNSGVPKLKYCFSHWLPAHALPIPTTSPAGQERADD